MMPTIDVYVLHFNASTKKGAKSYHDFMGQVNKQKEEDRAYMNVHEEDHLGHATVTINQFSNRRARLISMFEKAKHDGLIEEFQVYGN